MKTGAFLRVQSLLSEAAVLGFAYGYSLDLPPDALPLGEAAVRRLRQRAQVVIDQFIVSSESKMAAQHWHRFTASAWL